MYSKILSLTKMFSIDIFKFFMWSDCCIFPLGIQNLLNSRAFSPSMVSSSKLKIKMLSKITSSWFFRWQNLSTHKSTSDKLSEWKYKNLEGEQLSLNSKICHKVFRTLFTITSTIISTILWNSLLYKNCIRNFF